MQDDQRKGGGTNAHEGGKRLDGMYPVAGDGGGGGCGCGCGLDCDGGDERKLSWPNSNYNTMTTFKGRIKTTKGFSPDSKSLGPGRNL